MKDFHQGASSHGSHEICSISLYVERLGKSRLLEWNSHSCEILAGFCVCGFKPNDFLGIFAPAVQFFSTLKSRLCGFFETACPFTCTTRVSEVLDCLKRNGSTMFLTSCLHDSACWDCWIRFWCLHDNLLLIYIIFVNLNPRNPRNCNLTICAKGSVSGCITTPSPRFSGLPRATPPKVLFSLIAVLPRQPSPHLLSSGINSAVVPFRETAPSVSFTASVGNLDGFGPTASAVWRVKQPQRVGHTVLEGRVQSSSRKHMCDKKLHIELTEIPHHAPPSPFIYLFDVSTLQKGIVAPS